MATLAGLEIGAIAAGKELGREKEGSLRKRGN